MSSPLRHILLSCGNQAFITLTGFHVEAFTYLLQMFVPAYGEYLSFVNHDECIVKKLPGFGRPHSVCAEDCLGLVLAWMRTHCHCLLMALQHIFGMVISPVHEYLQFAFRMIINTFKEDPLTKNSYAISEETGGV